MFWLAAGTTPIHSPKATTTIARIFLPLCRSTSTVSDEFIGGRGSLGPPRNPRQPLGCCSRTQILGPGVPFFGQCDVGLYCTLGAHLREHGGIVGFCKRKCGRRIASFRRA